MRTDRLIYCVMLEALAKHDPIVLYHRSSSGGATSCICRSTSGGFARSAPLGSAAQAEAALAFVETLALGFLMT